MSRARGISREGQARCIARRNDNGYALNVNAEEEAERFPLVCKMPIRSFFIFSITYSHDIVPNNLFIILLIVKVKKKKECIYLENKSIYLFLSILMILESSYLNL